MAAISVRGLTKRFGNVTAVNDLSFDVEHGTITGFLGPNGSGKTTTLRMVLGLVHPTAGTALVDGSGYTDLDRPAFTVGAALEATGFHPGRTARNHLRILAQPNRISSRRVDEVLEEVDLTDAARRRVGGFPSGCGSGSCWPARCSVTRASCSSTSRPTAWTPPACTGYASSCAPASTAAALFWSPVTCSRSSPCPPTRW